jgi:hypothetical protein
MMYVDSHPSHPHVSTCICVHISVHVHVWSSRETKTYKLPYAMGPYHYLMYATCDLNVRDALQSYICLLPLFDGTAQPVILLRSHLAVPGQGTLLQPDLYATCRCICEPHLPGHIVSWNVLLNCLAQLHRACSSSVNSACNL